MCLRNDVMLMLLYKLLLSIEDEHVVILSLSLWSDDTSRLTEIWEMSAREVVPVGSCILQVRICKICTMWNMPESYEVCQREQCNFPHGQLCESNKRLSSEIQCFRKQFLFDDCAKATKKKIWDYQVINSGVNKPPGEPQLEIVAPLV